MASNTYLKEINLPSQDLMEPVQPKPPAKRILAIDTLRGFDMLMITGAGTFIYLLHGITNIAWVDALALQFEHPPWNGFTFYDFIFPLFLFIAGVSMPFSLSKGLELGLSKGQLYKKAFIRMLILIGLGIIDKNAPVPFFDWSEIRFVGVLQRIGFAGFIATILYLNFNSRQRIFWIAGILLFYYAAMFLIPVPGFGPGDLSIEGNLHGWIDRHFLPGRLLQKIYDENGLLTQLPALCLTVMGTLAGDVLRNETISDQVKLRTLLLTGGGCVIVGLLWSLHFPINKHLWSSSFIMLTGGMAFLSLGIFYWIIDILKYRKWTFFFIVIGMNSLTIYMAYRLIDFGHTSKLLFEGLYSWTEDKWHPVFESLGALAIVWLFLYTLYKLKIFWKV
jgi:predicted acyltransferase